MYAAGAQWPAEYHYMYALHYITLHYITLHCITLHYITLHYMYAAGAQWPAEYHYMYALPYITLHYIVLRCITCMQPAHNGPPSTRPALKPTVMPAAVRLNTSPSLLPVPNLDIA